MKQTNHEKSVAEPTQNKPVFIPATDIFQTSDGFTVVCDVPGVTLDSVDIGLENRELTISAAQAVQPHDAMQCIRRDYGVGLFQRTFSIPAEIDRDGIKAKLIDGVLTISLPHAEADKPRKIEVTIN